MKKEESKKLQKKKRRNRRRLFSLLVFILLLIYLPALWNWLFSANVEIGVIKTATLELKAPLRGVMVRKEELLASPGDGIIIPAVQYGDKVSAYQDIASYISTEMREMVNQYSQMRIEILRRAVTKFDSASGSERQVWESAIEKQIEKLSDLTNSGDLSNLPTLREAIDEILEARALYMLESSNTQDILKNEKNELKQLENSINKSMTQIRAPYSGVISYYCDGQEGTLLPEKRGEITAETIDTVISKEASSEKWITPSEIDVSEGESFGKLITNDEAWMVFYVDSQEGKPLSVEFEKLKLDEKELQMNVEIDGFSERVPVILESVAAAPGDKYLIVARMNRYIELTLDKRGFTGNLVLQSISGMKVPYKSLTGQNKVDDTADIIIVEMNKAVYKRVRIVATQDAYAIIENLENLDAEKNVNVYDVYVVNPKNIEEGQVINE